MHPPNPPVAEAAPPGGAPRALRIAYVTETWPPEVNGVAMSTARLVRGLARRGHRVQLTRPRQGRGDLPLSLPNTEELLTPACPLPFYPQLRAGFTWPGRLAQHWRQWRPDVVHLATEGPLCWSALQAAQQLGLPVSSDFRTNFHAYSRHYRLGWLQGAVLAYLRHFHRRTRCTIVPTEALRRELAAQGFEDLRVVARGVDTQLYTPERRSPALRAAWGVGPDDPVVACVGRLAAEKNLLTLIAAYETLRRRDPRARLLLVGDGPQRSALQARCPEAIFAGQRSGSDLAAHYASADLFAFPSMTETFGNVTPEAMASGLPVVAYDHAAAGQLLRHGESGLLLPLGDAPAFIDAVSTLAGDAAQRRAMGSKARAAMDTLGWDDVVTRFEALLAQLVAAPALPGPAPHASVALRRSV